MRHYLLTRAVYNPDTWPEDELRWRFDLFAHVTVPSLAGQSVKKAEWRIKVHPDDPLLGERIAAAMSTGFDVVVLPMVAGGKIDAKNRAQTGSWHTGTGRSRTTRLDDDDALAVTYFERLGACDFEADRIWTFPAGYRWAEGMVWSDLYAPNQFTSYDSPNGSRKTVVSFNHAMVRRGVAVDDEPAWLNVRHPHSVRVVRPNNPRPPVVPPGAFEPSEAVTDLFTVDWAWLVSVA